MRTLTLLALTALALTACTAPPLPVDAGVFRSPERTLNMAHQGGEDLWPSNTLIAYAGAARLGVDMMDTDLHATRDGVLVLSHDDTVDRLTDGHGAIRDLTFAELRALDAGYRFTRDDGRTYPYRAQGVRIPTAEEAFEQYGHFPWTIEIKQAQPSIARPFCDLIHRYGMQRKVMVASFSDDAMNDFRRTCPDVPTSMTERELRPLVLLSKVGLAALVPTPGAAAQVPVRSGGLEIVTPAFIRQMHARGVAVHVWTINDRAEMQRLIALGVDAIDTDRPDLLREALQAHAR
ncbi:glycerophosphodiester phosphodiesterase [Deinococcus maricopensis]|uniref:Glycerophosphoryl diester phosphodiesterase n=1 Tax=Deinococcus maricopensis (strain DSM 21211 / LMG 22137 / NRRL B-23946 / LB-34) TaxID=709986 RepID=E8U626_DEIML|nr:glycerophosphodiester phosphodiesterase [Deinococcus maricopensis]ADV66515.1 glycerophosphoryl diester phosphodiesterase [Deinococcus maricopensis DSM 21211]